MPTRSLTTHPYLHPEDSIKHSNFYNNVRDLYFWCFGGGEKEDPETIDPEKRDPETSSG